MALNAHSEQPDLSLPEDYKQHHPDEHPTDWGWHGEWGRAARISGWVIAILMLVMITTTHYNHSGSGWLIGSTAGLIAILIWDVQRRKHSWRK